MKVLISYPRNGEKEGRQIAQALQQQGAKVSIELNDVLPQNENDSALWVTPGDHDMKIVVYPKAFEEYADTVKPRPAELDVIAEVREFISNEMQLLENAKDVDSACKIMLEHCLQFKYAKYPAMAAIIHYLRNICGARIPGSESFGEFETTEQQFEYCRLVKTGLA